MAIYLIEIVLCAVLSVLYSFADWGEHVNLNKIVAFFIHPCWGS